MKRSICEKESNICPMCKGKGRISMSVYRGIMSGQEDMTLFAECESCNGTGVKEGKGWKEE